MEVIQRYYKNPCHRQGIDYELTLAMYFLGRLHDNGAEFRLAVEKSEDQKFDDLYVEVHRPKKAIFLVQAKHVDNTSKIITCEDLGGRLNSVWKKRKNVNLDNKFSLAQYFGSFLDIKRNGIYRNDWENLNFLICTTVMLDGAELCSKGIMVTRELDTFLASDGPNIDRLYRMRFDDRWVKEDVFGCSEMEVDEFLGKLLFLVTSKEDEMSRRFREGLWERHGRRKGNDIYNEVRGGLEVWVKERGEQGRACYISHKRNPYRDALSKRELCRYVPPHPHLRKLKERSVIRGPFEGDWEGFLDDVFGLLKMSSHVDLLMKVIETQDVVLEFHVGHQMKWVWRSADEDDDYIRYDRYDDDGRYDYVKGYDYGEYVDDRIDYNDRYGADNRYFQVNQYDDDDRYYDCYDYYEEDDVFNPLDGSILFEGCYPYRKSAYRLKRRSCLNRIQKISLALGACETRKCTFKVNLTKSLAVGESICKCCATFQRRVSDLGSHKNSIARTLAGLFLRLVMYIVYNNNGLPYRKGDVLKEGIFTQALRKSLPGYKYPETNSKELTFVNIPSPVADVLYAFLQYCEHHGKYRLLYKMPELYQYYVKNIFPECILYLHNQGYDLVKF